MKLTRKIALLALCAVLPFIAHSDTFNLFSPATGILKGSSTSYVTTPAVSSDVVSLWSGVCDAGSFLRGDGACALAPGTGTVTSVGLSMPAGFSVTGSPVTAVGTLQVSTALNGVITGTGSGFAAADSGDVISLWTGTCNAGTYLAGDGVCTPPPATGVTSITAGTGITASPNPIVSTGTISLNTTGNYTWSGDNVFTNNLRIADDDTSSILRIENTSQRSIQFDTNTVTPTASIDDVSTGSVGFHIDAKTNPLWLWTGGANRLTIDDDGSWDMAGSTPGAAGQVLTSNGAASAPTWQDAPGTVAIAKVNSSGTIIGGNSLASSAVRNSVGSYTVTWTTDIGNNMCLVSIAGTSGAQLAFPVVFDASPDTTSVLINVYDGVGTGPPSLVDVPGGNALNVFCFPL